jgi:hypothetical protein
MNAAAATGDRCHRASLAIDRGDEQAGRERSNCAAPRTRPCGNARVFDDQPITVRGDNVGSDLPRSVAARLGSSGSVGSLRGAAMPIARREPVLAVAL